MEMKVVKEPALVMEVTAEKGLAQVNLVTEMEKAQQEKEITEIMERRNKR